MKSGYKGYYNGMVLDSSYEYIYCKILESNNIKYNVHEKNYQLEGRQYIPDFFLYNQNEELYEIVEIRGHRLNLEDRIIDALELEVLIGIPVKVITELDLKVLCRESSLSYNKLKTEWRESPNTHLNNNSGEFNAMYGRKQSDEQKRKSSEKGKLRFSENPEKYHELCTSKLIAYNREHNFEQAKQPRSKRVEMICEECGKSKIVTEAYAERHRYCSIECGAKYGLRLATNKNIDNKIEKDNIINNIVLDYSKLNRSDILEIKLNKIQTSEIINTLIQLIKDKTGVFDMRTISTAVCGKPSRKEFVKYLKVLVE